MIFKNWLKLSLGSAAALAGLAAASDANAGAFAVREQSAYYQGMSFAGSGAGDQLSSMYWNSAAAAAAPGFNTESHAALVLPDSTISADDGLFVTTLGDGGSGDIGDGALVPSSYLNYQLSERLFFGLALNSPFGFTTKPDNQDWAGSPLAVTSTVFSINANPMLAYKLTPELTVGAGVQIQYIDVRLRNGANPLPAPAPSGPREVEGTDVGFGATAGVVWAPRPGTQFGLGYRSAIEVELNGDRFQDNLPAGEGKAKADFTLPDLVTLSLKHELTERLTVYGTVEWTNWSRLGVVDVNVNTGFTEPLAFDYEDGWFYSIGIDYKFNDRWAVRAGVAYEESPITDETRNVLLPDNERVWLSFGATHKYSEKITLDLAYTHIFVKDSPICRSVAGDCDGASPVLFEGEGEASVDIISASVKYKFSGGSEALEPLK